MATEATPHGSRPFDHVVIVMFENQYRSYVMANPYFAKLAAAGLDLSGSFGVMHPSQTNYIASVAGELCNVSDDDAPGALVQRTVIDLLEAAGCDWRAYMDSYEPRVHPWSPTVSPHNDYPYVIKHNPFSSFATIQNSQARWEKIVPIEQLFVDLDRGTLPEYSWITPDMWHDGHYVTGTSHEPRARAPELVDQAADWLESFFGELGLPGPDSRFPPRTLVVVTFDEADYEDRYDHAEKYTYDGPNQIYTVLLGDVITPGEEAEPVNHYSLLRTVEENFGLGTLGKNDASSNWLRFLWDERFVWDPPAGTPFAGARSLAAASDGRGGLLVVADDGGASLVAGERTGDEWSPTASTGIAVPTSFALVAGAPGEVVLARADDGAVRVTSYVDGTWSDDIEIGGDLDVATVAATALDGGDVLVVGAVSGDLWSIRRRAGRWEQPVAVGFAAEGAFTVTSLGATVLLLVEVPSSATVNAITMNVAEYNVVTVAPSEYGGAWNDATIDVWSPSAFPVAHFTAGPDPRTPGEPEPKVEAYDSIGPLVAACHDGVVHLVHASPDGISDEDGEAGGSVGEGAGHLVDDTFSLAGMLTPRHAVSYDPSENDTTSNGYGTIAQAGWGERAAIAPVGRREVVPLALTSGTDGPALFVADREDGTVGLITGGYRRRS